MNIFKNSVLSLGRVAALGMFLSLTPLKQAKAAGPDVTVDNSDLNPVPTVATGTTTVDGSVAITGTPNVSVTNFPATQAVTVTNLPATQPVSGTVNVGNFPATQPVSGTVNVGNLPPNQAVSVTNFPATQAVTITNLPSTQGVSVNNFPATQTVNVANSAGAPVQVADVERMARIPYLSSVSVPAQPCTPSSQSCVFFFATPPQGTRLVAENLSGYFQISPGTTVPVVGYVEDSASFSIFTGFTAPLAGLDGGGHTQAAFNQPTRFYVDGGDGVLAVVSSSWSNGATTVVLSGYLENCSITGCPAIAH